MKIQGIIAIFTTLWVLPVGAGPGNGQNQQAPAPSTAPAPTTAPGPISCSSADCSQSCAKIAGCEWSNSAKVCREVQHSETHVTCGDRSLGSCEDDDLCMKFKGSCVEVNLGVGVEGQACQVTLDLDSDNTTVFRESTNMGCAPGFICNAENIMNGTIGEVVNGVCSSTKCLGKKVPGNCNDNLNRNQIDTKDQCNATTQRVTICHRTCSEKNPWVRITIDEDAWSGEGCGHKLQHNVEDECKNKFPWTAWGVNRRDYLIKFHGTREFVRQNNSFTPSQEKEYWRKWEPACPYVRNGKCCQWNSIDNPCCGEPPSTATPTITHKKYVGPPGSCNAAGLKNLQDDTYSAKTGSNYAYCYVTSVPADAEECLYAVTMKDPAPNGGLTQDVKITGDFELLCPNNVTYVEGPIVQVLQGGEGPYNSTVKGIGAKSGKTVTSTDPAAVKEIPVDVFPVVEIKKYAGPPSMCSDAGLMNMYDVIYTLPTAGSSWQYCYVITVPTTAKECLSKVTMVDAAPLGGTVSPIEVTTGSEELCKGAKTYIDGHQVTGLTATEGPFAANVTGTGVTTGSQVSASDDAAVTPPPIVEIKKYAGPEGKCSAADIMNNITLDDTYTLPTSTASWQYCYVISVPATAPECLYAVSMVDSAPIGGTLISGAIEVTIASEKLCPGNTTYVNGKPVLDGLKATEGPYNATVTGTGVTSGTKVSDVDDATVSPPPIPVSPVIEIKKYAGPEGKCNANDFTSLQDVLYTLPSADASWQYCYVITVPSNSTECVSAVTMVDTALYGGTNASFDQICIGEDKYVAGRVVPGLSATEGPVLATVTGKGSKSNSEVSDSDDATVSPPPNPVIEIKKYAGPKGKCTADDIMNKTIFDDTYTLPSGDSTWQYCYVITVPSTSTECISGVKMVDDAPKGGLTIDLGQLCWSDVKHIPGPSVDGLEAPEGPIDATVTGKGATSGQDVTAKDSATVKPPSEDCQRPTIVAPKCPDDVSLKSEPATEYPFNPITIISQNSDNVTLTISNPFESTVQAMYYQFATAETGTSKCDSVSPFTYCQDPITVTAHCMHAIPHPLAVVDIWFVDPTVVDRSDNDTLPLCCQPDAEDVKAPKVVYTFKVYCESICDTDKRRQLADSTEPLNDLASLPKPDGGVVAGKQELCSLDTFACGDNGKSVHVCHYSAKDGYQTYCVPQADSDVVAYFPKDYCGPCVGGYANVDASSEMK